MHSCASIDAIAGYAGTAPHSPALIEPDGVTLSYKELWTQIRAVGLRLEEAGVGVHETVAVLMPQGPLQILAVAGVMSRCVCIPLQPRTTVAEVTALLRMVAPTAILVSPEFEVAAEAASAMGLTVLVARNTKHPDDWQIRRSASPCHQLEIGSETILLLITSATTGTSKLVPLTAANLDAQAAPRSKVLRLSSSDRLLQMTSLGHSIGIDNTFAQFLVGGAIIATGGFDPTSYLRWLQDLGPTWYDCAPTVHQAALAQLKRTPPEKPIFLRFVQSAGAPLPCEVKQELEQILRVPVLSDYGMTETGPIATDAYLPGGRVPNSVGRTCGLEISIINSLGETLPAEAEGEIAVRGAAVCSGYAHNPGANLTAFRNGWFSTGDAGRLDKEGNLFVTGRLKEMINRGGEKILPREVDAALATHPAVLEAAAFPVPHPTLGEDVACAVVLCAPNDPPVSTAELRRFVAERLARFKVPHRIYFVDQIPKGEMGKPLRWQLSERFSVQRIPSFAKVNDDIGDVFYKLHEIWARILDRNDLGFDEDFFNAGGDSLAAIHMLAEVDQRFGANTGAFITSFLDEPTLIHLMKLVGEIPPPRPAQSFCSDIQVFPVRDSGLSRRVFCVPADGEEGLYFRRLATHLRGYMDLFIVRPINTFYSDALYAFERAGTEMAAIIRQAQPEGPYILAGYCYGGIVAVEAVQQLLLEGQTVRLILFDVPMPGSPNLLSYWRIWIERARRKWSVLGRGNNSEFRANRHSVARSSTFFAALHLNIARCLKLLVKIAGLMMHRLAWSAAVAVRELLVSIEKVPGIRWSLVWMQRDYFPLYKASPVDAPILHFLCEDEPRVFDGAARFGWREVAQGGIEERYVPLDHSNVFHESNLHRVVNIIEEWCDAKDVVPSQ